MNPKFRVEKDRKARNPHTLNLKKLLYKLSDRRHRNSREWLMLTGQRGVFLAAINHNVAPLRAELSGMYGVLEK
jgi:hypothetical protein